MADDDSVANPPIKQVNQPSDTAVNQQRMKSWNPILDPLWVIVSYLALGVIFLPVGFKINSIADGVHEMSIKYDSHDGDSSCHITEANANKKCTVSFVAKENMEPPILVYYEVENFYQNHRKYEKSRDDAQLLGSMSQTDTEAKLCKPLNKLGDITINPCGLVANTLFNDVIKLKDGSKDKNGNDLKLIENGIAWQSDLDYKFKQPGSGKSGGFKMEACADCGNCTCAPPEWSCTNSTPYKDEDGTCYKYFYPNDDKTQYLYETYPMVVSPIEGVKNEHFIVWMRTEAVTPWRKLYGHFQEPIAKGEKISFDITANWDVTSFKGSKTLIVTTTEIFGGKNKALGLVFVICGACLLALGIAFGIKHYVWPRKLASKKYLRFKEE
jgi:hypothetical protein